MTKRSRHEENAYPTDETIRKIQQDANSLSEGVRTKKEEADRYAAEAKKRLYRTIEKNNAQRRDAKRRP